MTSPKINLNDKTNNISSGTPVFPVLNLLWRPFHFWLKHGSFSGLIVVLFYVGFWRQQENPYLILILIVPISFFLDLAHIYCGLHSNNALQQQVSSSFSCRINPKDYDLFGSLVCWALTGVSSVLRNTVMKLFISYYLGFRTRTWSSAWVNSTWAMWSSWRTLLHFSSLWPLKSHSRHTKI